MAKHVEQNCPCPTCGVGMITPNPTWYMHRSPRTGSFAYRGELIRSTERNCPMEYAENPELLLVGNPRKSRRSKMRLRVKHRRRRGSCKCPRRVSYRGHRYYFIELYKKFGRKASGIWKRHTKTSKVRHRTSKKLLGHGSWKALVKKHGVMGAKKRYHRRRR